MKFSNAAEVHKDAYPALRRVRTIVDDYILGAMKNSRQLDKLDIEIRYVPILMPPDFIERYPARSKLLLKKKEFDCSPQLNYEVFVSGTFEQQVNEYVRGLSDSVPYLKELGATPEQTAEYKAILEKIAPSVIDDKPSNLH